MAGASFSMNMSGVMNAMDGSLRRVRRTQQLSEDIGEALVSGVQDRFEAEEAPDGAAWTPSKRVKEEGGKTLTDTARLKNSIGYAASPSKVVVGTNVVSARAHQNGLDISILSTKRRVKLPARPILGISDADADEIKALQQEFMRNVLLGR